MDDESDAIEAFERDLFKLQDGHGSSSDGETEEFEELLYSNTHYASDLTTLNFKNLEKCDANDEHFPPLNDQDDHDDENKKEKNSEETKKKLKKTPTRRYYDQLDDYLKTKLSNKICDTCKEKGHVKRHCPNWKSNMVCYRCNETGHFSRDCPNQEKNSMTCYNCNQVGHIARDCTNAQFPVAGTEKYKTCYRCDQVGHIAKDCKQEIGMGADIGRQDTCFNCNRKGHFARDCPKLVVCRVCKEAGHVAADCARVSDEVTRYMCNKKFCNDCGGAGHSEEQCIPTYNKSVCNQQSKRCKECAGVGHLSHACPNLSNQVEELDKMTSCRCCGATGHFARHCPDARDLTLQYINQTNGLCNDVGDSPMYKSKWCSGEPLGTCGDTSNMENLNVPMLVSKEESTPRFNKDKKTVYAGNEDNRSLSPNMSVDIVNISTDAEDYISPSGEVINGCNTSLRACEENEHINVPDRTESTSNEHDSVSRKMKTKKKKKKKRKITQEKEKDSVEVADSEPANVSDMELDRKTLNHLRDILWDSADSDDSADIPDILPAQNSVMTAAQANTVVVNLDSDIEEETGPDKMINSKTNDGFPLGERINHLVDGSHYNPKYFDFAHLEMYGIQYSLTTGLIIDRQHGQGADKVALSSIAPTQPAVKTTRPQHENDGTNFKIKHVRDKIQKKKNKKIILRKLKTKIRGDRSDPGRFSRNNSSAEQRGFLFRKKKNSVIVID